MYKSSDPFSASKKRANNAEAECADDVITIDEGTENRNEGQASAVNKSAEIFRSIFAKGRENSAAVSAAPRWKSEDFRYDKEGKEWNLKLVTWNINGIRAWMEVSF